MQCKDHRTRSVDTAVATIYRMRCVRHYLLKLDPVRRYYSWARVRPNTFVV
ncbi:hypothetical protein ACQKGL_18320 [Ensifer adhaerens]|uniref:hypothetical protein n=1 Tax=Ensifer adhaerens TaxID=106592 RepID=UPI003CFD4E95